MMISRISNGTARVLRCCTILLLGILAGCTTVPTRQFSEGDYPLLSWRDTPEESIAVSWYDRPGISGIELTDEQGETRVIDAEYRGPVTRVLVDGLTPGTRYRYRAIPAGTGVWRSFSTPSDNTERVSFAVAGDLQPFNTETVRTTTNTLTKIASLQPAFILQTGDVTEVGTSRRSWRLATTVISAAAAEIPFMATAGNHDYYYGIRSAENFKMMFPAPFAEGADKQFTWYSFTVGPVHICVMDSEMKGKDFDRQLQWLRQDMEAARSAGSRWLFVAMHRPIFTASGRGIPEWAETMLPLFAEYEVDAVFWGHEHLYEHYAYQYGANGYLFDETHETAGRAIHFFTAGTSGARVDSIYYGFLSRVPIDITLDMYSRTSGSVETLEFERRQWNPARVKHTQPGIRYQDPEAYPKAGSYYLYPFDDSSDALDGKYSSDPLVSYADDTEFFGYTYGETSIHYLWVEASEDECIITARYADGPLGVQGSVITDPGGRVERWVIPGR